MALVPNECDQFKARLTCRSNWKILETIKNTLGGDNKMKFKKSCFGHFWRMERLKFQGQLYLHLLFRQDTSGSTDKIVFHINNKEAEFGMNEFSLITGLHFGPKQQIPTCSDLHQNVFRGKPILYLKDVEDALKSVAEKDKGRGENSLKVALLYFLYGILIVRDRMKKIDMQYIHLADNLEMFNKYPWGCVTFEFLVADTRSCMDGKVVAYWRRVEKKKNHTMEWFDVCGFTHALQVWAYEMMPDVAKLCATRVHKNEGRVPRILQWSATSVHSFEELKRTVFFTAMPGNQIADHITVLPKLEASLEESKEPFYESLVGWQEELAKSKQEKLERRAKKMKIVHEAPREEESAPQDQWSKKHHDPPQPAEAQPQSTEATGSRLDGEIDISESQINEYKEIVYKFLKFQTYKIRAPNGKFRCPFCVDKEELDCQYTHLLQHAIRVAEDSEESGKQRANHSAVATYLATDLANEHEAEQLTQNTIPSPAAESDEDFKKAMDSVQRLVERIKEKENELLSLKELLNHLVSKDLESNKELQKARKELIKGWGEMPSDNHAGIGVKEMGRIDDKPFQYACKKKFAPGEADIRALELCSLWQEKLKNPEWHPFRVIEDDKGNTKKLLNEDDELLQGLKREWGKQIHDAVVAALEELHEYNASGCYEVSELWNFKDNTKATLQDGIKCVFAQLKSLKRKRA